MEAAAAFLRRFDWKNYKAKIKSNLIHKIKPLIWELSNVRDVNQVLKILGIKNDEKLLEKINLIKDREEPYNVLWIDDAFTYPLPMALLQQLNIKSHIARSSDEALTQLINKNKTNSDPLKKIDLIISDLTRDEREVNPRTRGITFCEFLEEDPILKKIPVIIYAKNKKELIEIYQNPLPLNIKNHSTRNTILHKDFIREVVGNIQST